MNCGNQSELIGGLHLKHFKICRIASAGGFADQILAQINLLTPLLRNPSVRPER
jgi:hypothetical protein